jgi:hypothetical protein
MLHHGGYEAVLLLLTQMIKKIARQKANQRVKKDMTTLVEERNLPPGGLEELNGHVDRRFSEIKSQPVVNSEG